MARSSSSATSATDRPENVASATVEPVPRGPSGASALAPFDAEHCSPSALCAMWDWVVGGASWPPQDTPSTPEIAPKNQVRNRIAQPSSEILVNTPNGGRFFPELRSPLGRNE